MDYGPDILATGRKYTVPGFTVLGVSREIGQFGNQSPFAAMITGASGTRGRGYLGKNYPGVIILVFKSCCVQTLQLSL